MEYVAAASLRECLIEEKRQDNYIFRIKLSNKDASNSVFAPELMKHRGNSGYFYEYDAKDILEIESFCNDARCQTIGYFGNKDILNPLLLLGNKGIDRIVPIGHTMDFDLIWDGYDLTDRFTRYRAQC